MRKLFEIGGLVAAAVLIAFGITAIVMGVNGRSTVRDSLKLEQIVGSPDMTPSAIAAEAKKAGLPRIDQPPDDRRRRQADQHRRPRPRLRVVHADPHARGNRRRAILADAAFRDAQTARAPTMPQRPCRRTAARSTTPPATSG